MELTVVRSKHRDGVYVHSIERDLKFLWSLSINYYYSAAWWLEAEMQETVTAKSNLTAKWMSNMHFIWSIPMS